MIIYLNYINFIFGYNSESFHKPYLRKFKIRKRENMKFDFRNNFGMSFKFPFQIHYSKLIYIKKFFHENFAFIK